jgi:hypothetical protein
LPLFRRSRSETRPRGAGEREDGEFDGRMGGIFAAGAVKERRHIVGGAQPIVFPGEDYVFKPWHNVKRRGHIVFKARIIVDGLNTLCSSPATLCRRLNPCRKLGFYWGAA